MELTHDSLVDLADNNYTPRRVSSGITVHLVQGFRNAPAAQRLNAARKTIREFVKCLHVYTPRNYI